MVPADSVTGLLDLPNELLLDIADWLDTSADLNALVQANSSTHSVLNKKLYRRDAKGNKAVALFTAAEFGLLRTAQLSLEQGADVSITRTFPSHHFDSVKLLRSEGDIIVSPLLVAIACQQESLAVFFITQGANTDFRLRSSSGLSALHIASGHGLTTVIKALLDKGVRVDSRDERGSTPLHHAVVPTLYGRAFGKPKAVSLLLQHGASVTAADQAGITPENLLRARSAGGWDASITINGRRVSFNLGNAVLDEDSLSRERQIKALLEGARAAVEMEKLDKSRAKNKAKKLARDRAKIEEARKKDEARAQKLKEDAERKRQEEAEMCRARDAKAAKAKEKIERLKNVENAHTLLQARQAKQAARATAWGQMRRDAETKSG